MDSSETKPSKQDLIVMLVHGTWAPSAGWTKKGSKLRAFLEERLSDKYNLYFEVFQWRGDLELPFNNSHRHRIKAGEQLREKLIQLQEHYPAALKFVIAHSHGGNVALYALRDPDMQRQVSGLVCMGTPFLKVKRRDTVVPRSIITTLVLAVLLPWVVCGASIYAIMMVSIQFIVLLVPCIALAVVLSHFFSGKAATFVWLCACYIWMPFAMLGWLTSRTEKKTHPLFSRSKSWIKNRAEALIKRWYRKLDLTLDAIDLPDASNLPVLCVMSKTDEAFGPLSMMNFLSELPFKAWNRYVYLVLFVLLWASLFSSKGSTALAGGPYRSIVSIVSSLCIAAFITFLMAACHALVLSLVAYVRYIGFGFEAWMSSALAQIGISRTPSGKTERHEIRSYPYSRRAFLNHSALYVDEKPLSDIADWLEQAATRRVSNPKADINSKSEF